MPIPTRGPHPPGFSLPELLLVIGIILILSSLLLPALGRARSSSRAIACAVEMRQMTTRVWLYAGDNADAVPFVYHRDTVTGAWTSPSGHPLPGPEYLDTAADFWAYPMLDEFGGSFIAPVLLCPNDTTTLPAAEWASSQTGVPVDRVGVPMARALSRAFYHTPRSLAADRVTGTASQFRVARLSDVRFPSAKALLIEDPPFHEPGFVGPEIPPELIDHRKTVSATDGSSQLRSNTDAVPPVLPVTSPAPPGIDPIEYERIQRRSVAFHYTRDGIEGRDW